MGKGLARLAQSFHSAGVKNCSRALARALPAGRSGYMYPVLPRPSQSPSSVLFRPVAPERMAGSASRMPTGQPEQGDHCVPGAAVRPTVVGFPPLSPAERAGRRVNCVR
jgi:hypothetical protein